MVAKFRVGEIVAVTIVGEVTESKVDRQYANGEFKNVVVYTIKQIVEKDRTQAIAIVYNEDAINHAETPAEEIASGNQSIQE